MVKGLLVICSFSALAGLLLTSCVSVAEEGAGLKRLAVVYSEDSTIELFGFEKLHPFDIKKYDKIRNGLVKSGHLTYENEYSATALTREDLLLIHSEGYLDSLNDKALVARYLEAPALTKIPFLNIKKHVVDRFLTASGGTLKAARLALKEGVALNLGGGYHHAMPDRGEGFCLIADVPIAIRKLQSEGLIKRALVIDTDIHQGNGTIVCLKNDPTTYTFSMHEGDIYPQPKERGDLDTIVPAGVTDAWYNAKLKSLLPKVFAASRPDIVFHVAGCDALDGDPLANGKMTALGISARDRMIYEYCKARKIPYVMTLAGGYSKGAWKAQLLSIQNLMEVD